VSSGIINILIGAALFGLGASGRFKLIGTGSSWPLMVVGGAVAAIGIFQLIRRAATRHS